MTNRTKLKQLKKKDSPSTLRRINNALSLIVFVLAFYIVLLPLVPNLHYWFNKATYHYPTLVKQNLPSSKGSESIPAENTLVIPDIGSQQVVYDGPTSGTLAKGVWRIPSTSNPTQGSNTVFAGHRFTYTQPEGVFYNLDKVKLGDKIVLYWNQEKYTYKVTNVVIVPPTAVEIQAPTADPMLTLYTCTPLWSASDRLVVQAVFQKGVK